MLSMRSGTYSDESRASSCSICAEGKYNTNTGQTACTECDAGKYLNDNGYAAALHDEASDCLDCETGKYGSTIGAASCTFCAAGRSVNETGSTSCEACLPGRYASTTGAAACALCSLGTHSPELGAASCVTCVSPTTSDGVGKPNCSACVSNYYWDGSITKDQRNNRNQGDLNLKGLGTCTQCPKGTNCANSTVFFKLEELPVRKHYYRFSTSATEVYKCDSKSCNGGSTVGRASCKPNARGPLCSLCKKSYFRLDSGYCEPCSSSNVAESLVVIFCIISILAVAIALPRFIDTSSIQALLKKWFENNKFRFEWSALTVRTILYNFQVVSKFSQLQDIEWPSPFKEFMQFMDLIALDFGTWFPGIKCVGSFSLYSTFMTWTVGRFVVLFGVIAVGAWIKVKKTGCTLAVGVRHATEDIAGPGLQILSLVHTIICVELFEIYDCDSFNIGANERKYMSKKNNHSEQRFLASDYSINCETPTHKNYQNFGYFLIVVYVALVPSALTWYKYCQKEGIGISSASPFSSIFGSFLLESPFTQFAWWFDTVDLYYRLSMTGFLIVASKSRNERLVASVLISFVFFAGGVFLRPWLAESHNRVMITGQFVVVLTVYVGSVVSIQGSDSTSLGVSLILINLAVIAL